MYKKLAVILTIVFLASASQVYESDSVTGAIDDLLKTLQEVVDKAITQAHKDLNAAENAVNETAAMIEAEVAKNMKILHEMFVKDLDELKAKAKEAAVNIDECLGKDEEDLINLPTANSKDIVQCIQHLLDEVANLVSYALSKLQDFSEDVAKIKKEIIDCGTGLTAVACLDKVTKEIEKDIIVLPKEITQIVDEVLNSIQKITPEIKICKDDKIHSINYQGRILLTKIKYCVNNKIIH